MAPQFYSVIGNRDFLKMRTPDGIRRDPIWKYIEEHDHWLTSLMYLNGVERPRGRFLLDCGAWSYRNAPDPLWTPAQCVEQYERFAHTGDIVTAPDHMVLNHHDVAEQERRMRIIRENAREFIRICPKQFVPLAVTHGNTMGERVELAKAFLDMGYRYIAIGSVAARSGNRKFIRSAIEAILALRDKQMFSIHVLGVSALSWYREYEQYGITSFDGSSMFFRAFTAATYMLHDGMGGLEEHSVKSENRQSIPACDCNACVALAAQGNDTRQMGSNENNMGRAVHNINNYIRALNYLKKSGKSHNVLSGTVDAARIRVDSSPDRHGDYAHSASR